MKSSKRLTRLLPRDNYLCGIHVGGCGKPIPNRKAATVDHIFTQSFFKDREDGVEKKHYNEDWNLQPMHHACNNERGGQIYGFPLFTCSCHWLQIERTTKGNILVLHRRVGKDETVFPVSSEEHNFVFNNISTGKFAAELGGSIELEVGSVWSMGNIPPGKKGITGKGQLGHAVPRISPEEVQQFNRLEIQRIQGRSSQTIEKFNRRMDPMSIRVYFETVDQASEGAPP